MAGAFDTIAAQRDIDIFPKPRAEGDVPTAPKLGDTFGNIWVVKVFREVKAQHSSQTDRHQRIAAEIEIDLEAVCQYAQPHKRSGNIGKSQSLHLGPQRADGICKQNLACKSHDEQSHTLLNLGKGNLAVL